MRKISVRLWGLMLCLIGITIIILWLTQIQFLDKFYLDRQTKNILKNGYELAEYVLRNNLDVNNNEFKGKLIELNLKYNANIEIYTKENVLTYTNDEYDKTMSGINKMGLLMQAEKHGKVVRIIKDSRLGYQELLACISVVSENNSIMGYIILLAPLAPVHETVDILKEQLVYITLFLIMISFVLSFFFSRIFTRPILQINKAAKRMADGDFDIDIKVKRKDELGDLAKSMNNLSGQLKIIDNMRKELIANVSHEFRTPLSLIHGYAETIKDVTGENALKRNIQLNIIMDETDRLSGMVDDMLEYSKIQSGSIEYQFRKIDLVELARCVVNRFDYVSEKRNQRIVFESHEGIILVLAAEKQINQVFYNMINNAFVHSESTEDIKVRIIKKETEKGKSNICRVEIINYGNVISDEDMKFIWDRFHKVDKQRNKGGGSGLGLAIVKEILKAHNSEYGVESSEENGTIFWFELKIEEE